MNTCLPNFQHQSDIFIDKMKTKPAHQHLHNQRPWKFNKWRHVCKQRIGDGGWELTTFGVSPWENFEQRSLECEKTHLAPNFRHWIQKMDCDRQYTSGRYIHRIRLAIVQKRMLCQIIRYNLHAPQKITKTLLKVCNFHDLWKPNMNSVRFIPVLNSQEVLGFLWRKH